MPVTGDPDSSEGQAQGQGINETAMTSEKRWFHVHPQRRKLDDIARTGANRRGSEAPPANSRRLGGNSARVWIIGTRAQLFSVRRRTEPPLVGSGELGRLHRSGGAPQTFTANARALVARMQSGEAVAAVKSLPESIYGLRAAQDLRRRREDMPKACPPSGRERRSVGWR